MIHFQGSQTLATGEGHAFAISRTMTSTDSHPEGCDHHRPVDGAICYARSMPPGQNDFDIFVPRYSDTRKPHRITGSDTRGPKAPPPSHCLAMKECSGLGLYVQYLVI
jgi:hypothetical protein